MNENQPVPDVEAAGTTIAEWIRLNGSLIRRITQWLQIGTGLVLVAIAWTMGKTPLTLLTAGASTTGQIVRFEAVSSRSRAGLPYSAFHPVVEFTAGGGRVQFRDRWGSGSSGGVHAAVPVLYDPRMPSLALINRPVLNWMPWAPMMAVGVFLMVVGALGKLRGVKATNHAG